MGDQDDRALVVLQVVLEPLDRLGVEVVRGLVQQQHVRLLQQDPAQGDPPLLATAELGDLRVRRWEPERVHGHLDLPVQVPEVQVIDLLLDPGLLVDERLHLVVAHRLGEGRVDLVVALQDLPLRLHRLFHVPAHVQRWVQLRLLGQVPHLHPLRRPRLALEVLIDPRHDPQHRALAGAVRPHHPDLRARVEAEPDPLQDLPLRRDHLLQVLHHEDELRRVQCHAVSGW